ncbi:zinc finger protein 143-like [Cimex lectularius]|uniref:C2H2-type domain-containing protein n=1 Tax=Cimex lectularius TaxID=79782 RepID=A0A8I6RCG4_CIMLE|nr:zinc finger protein 143-like [Cimex lectularius]XP_014241206.1 zinc finger protein 143-like [Cimex lectularius]XP_014241207.1 zinc finger protein 143-like [Cimex lectularius]
MEETEQTCGLIPVSLDLNNATFIHLSDEVSPVRSVELVRQEDLLKLSDGIVTLEDGSQWYKIPLEEEAETKEVYIEGVSTEWGEEDVYNETLEEQTERVNATDEESFAQVIVLEDGSLAYFPQHLEDKTQTVVQNDSKTPAKKERTHQCSEPGCKRSYKSLHHLKVHIRNHTGDRPYKCSMEGCEKAFATDYSRKAHLRTHTGEKPYPCPECLKSFKTSGDLQKHIRTHTGERPFKCPVVGCNKSFTTSNIRKIHIRTHTGERPYVCNFKGCDRSFASSTNHKNHMRIHSGEKPYVCSIENCEKRFTEYSSLYKHNLVHSQVKNYQCSYCLKTYRQLSTLTTHKRTIHGVIAAEDGTEVILEQMRVGKDGSKNFKNITSNLLSLRKEHSAIENVDGNIYIIDNENEITSQFEIEEVPENGCETEDF